jgi:hypothetical protein
MSATEVPAYPRSANSLSATSRMSCRVPKIENTPGGGDAEMMELVRVADGRVAELWGLSSLTWRPGSEITGTGVALTPSRRADEPARREEPR